MQSRRTGKRISIHAPPPASHEAFLFDQPNPEEKSWNKENSSVYVFNTHVEAEEAIRSLGQAGLDIKKLSLVGKGCHSEEHPVGVLHRGRPDQGLGRHGRAFWGGIWGLLLAPAMFFLPGIGLVALAGPFVATLVSALEGAVVVGGMSALVAQP